MDELSPYWIWAMSVTASTYAFFRLACRHLSKEIKESFTLFFWGDYESTWSVEFCHFFDSVFGKKHLSWGCFFRSCIASAIFVLFLYILIGPILGLLETRFGNEYSLAQVLILGMIINFIPDYISLYETRWVLNKFKNIHSFRITALILFIDLLISALIVTPSIFLYYFFTDSEQGLAHTVGLYSITSIFFYSTFFTSFLSWIYGFSYLIMKIFQKWKLHKILEVEEKPISTLGVIATFLVLLLTATGSYIVENSSNKTETISIFDRMMCDWQPQVCPNSDNKCTTHG